MRLLAVVAGLCLSTGGMVLLPFWLDRVLPDPDDQPYLYRLPPGAPDPPGPDLTWPILGSVLVGVGLVCGGAALLWLVFRLISRLR
ncbi:hypothetical protein WHI96_02420 [Pseudonocardia tropica]|uniref:Uncharacterized protein n=1 Tax=Pseudonocardia tropica TaxID=681289 RepID=A0ABV1JPM8_9PSEU